MAITGTAAKKIDQNLILLDAISNPFSGVIERDTGHTQQYKKSIEKPPAMSTKAAFRKIEIAFVGIQV